MRPFVLPLLLIAALAGVKGQYLTEDEYNANRVNSTKCSSNEDDPNESIYKYTFQSLDGSENYTFNQFANQVLLVVNVATYWGFTYHYTQLNALKNHFGSDKLEIVAFPCNQFGLQEPGSTPAEIINGVRYVRPGNNFEPNFMMAKKIEVNGEKEEPIYTYLKRSCPSTRIGFASPKKLFYEPLRNRDIRWNWEKFLIEPLTGRPVKRYDASYGPDNMVDDIEALLRAKNQGPTELASYNRRTSVRPPPLRQPTPAASNSATTFQPGLFQHYFNSFNVFN